VKKPSKSRHFEFLIRRLSEKNLIDEKRFEGLDKFSRKAILKMEKD
jgi:hypothetical protein